MSSREEEQTITGAGSPAPRLPRAEADGGSSKEERAGSPAPTPKKPVKPNEAGSPAPQPKPPKEPKTPQK